MQDFALGNISKPGPVELSLKVDHDYGKHLGPTTGTDVDFDKLCVFCGKCCVRIDKFVFIIVKIKCMNSGRISDICDKHTQILQFLTHST